MYVVILAGGAGKRFWPLSRRENPKQFLDIIEKNRSMLRLTYDRLKNITGIENIYLVAGSQFFEKTLDDLPEFPQENYIMEPSGKNTAPCIGLAAIHLMKKDPEAVMGVFPADHHILNTDEFIETVKLGENIAREKNGLVTFGINPTKPATGYGYIQIDKRNEFIKNKVYKVKTFAEKPNLETAVKFLETREFLWNSGMFVWKVSVIMNALRVYMPELYESLMRIHDAIDKPRYEHVLKTEWALIHPESIDYGVMEKAGNVFVVKSDFFWSDVGSWDSVYELSKKDESGNVASDKFVEIDTEGCLISSKKLVATVGVKDLIIIQSGDAVLIAKRGESEKVKQIVEKLEKMGLNKYL
ncbi:MAG: mannose-1-phosphate guanylyltransferase [Candidatus Marinimicrobia bacterium]|nr:mannose-1-phosphate guanylyltransferase [Candidatus Neomarinimicrobiota bacterium]